MRTAKWRSVILLVIVLVSVQFASPSTPALMNDLPLGRCYSRCADSILLDFDWCADVCRCVLDGSQATRITR